MKKEVEVIKTDLEKAQELINIEKTEREKRVSERINALLEEEKASISVVNQMKDNVVYSSIVIKCD
jgi:hypothetical protein